MTGLDEGEAGLDSYLPVSMTPFGLLNVSLMLGRLGISRGAAGSCEIGSDLSREQYFPANTSCPSLSEHELSSSLLISEILSIFRAPLTAFRRS